MKIEITASNAWASDGKHYRGEKLDLSTDEAELLIANGLAKKVAGRPKKEDMSDEPDPHAR